MQQYLDFLKTILDTGVDRDDRTGTGTRSIFGYEMRFDLQQGFPLVTTKKVHLKSVIYELLWFLRGDTNIEYLADHQVTIWNAWADDNGDLGPIYGKQWRRWQTPGGQEIDQIQVALDLIRHRPESRRIIVNAWNVGELAQMALTPCHAMIQFYVANRQLSCKLTQRSADAFLGVPFNIASYALLTHMLAQQADLGVGEFVWSGGDCHVYSNHFEQVKLQLTREPKPLPRLQLRRKPDSIDAYQYEDFTILDYHPHPKIAAPIAV